MRDAVKAKRQARTDAAIEKFENSFARSLVKNHLLVNAAHDALVKASSLCEQDFELHKSNAMPLYNYAKIYHNCIQSAIDAYNADINSLSTTPNNDRALLIAELENTLNHPLYSQDFEPYWRS